jgi:hypothetical protein
LILLTEAEIVPPPLDESDDEDEQQRKRVQKRVAANKKSNALLKIHHQLGSSGELGRKEKSDLKLLRDGNNGKRERTRSSHQSATGHIEPQSEDAPVGGSKHWYWQEIP